VGRARGREGGEGRERLGREGLAACAREEGREERGTAGRAAEERKEREEGVASRAGLGPKGRKEGEKEKEQMFLNLKQGIEFKLKSK
jgi:hypothetical protein